MILKLKHVIDRLHVVNLSKRFSAGRQVELPVPVEEGEGRTALHLLGHHRSAGDRHQERRRPHREAHSRFPTRVQVPEVCHD